MTATGTDESIRAIALRLARPSSFWSETDEEKGMALACMLVDTLNAKATELCRQKVELPIAYSYQSDATSFLTNVVVMGSSDDGPGLRRDGRELSNFLIERGHIQLMMGLGAVKSAIIIRPPRFLKYGEGISACVSAYQEFFPSLRQFRRGIVINHKSFDRALYEGLEQDLRAMSDAKFICDELRPDYIQDADLDFDLEWHVGTACPYHDLMGGFRNGMAPFTSAEAVSDLFIAVESIRNVFRGCCRR